MSTTAKRRTLYQARLVVKTMQTIIENGDLPDATTLPAGGLDVPSLERLWDDLDTMDSEIWFTELMRSGGARGSNGAS